MRYFRLTACLLVVGVIGSACLKEKALNPLEIGFSCSDSDSVSFSNEIKAEIFDVSCNVSDCHDATTASSGFVFENYEQISSNSEILVRALNHDPSISPTMPFGGSKIVDSLIQKFECWIDQGKPNN